jgi:L-threonylcarbamoyladenylate synthase
VTSLFAETEFVEAISILKNGGVVVVPTETAYGLAADATNAEAVGRVQRIKGREAWKTPPLIVDSIEMAEQYIEITPKLRKLVETHWPGPLSIIGQAKELLLSKQVIREDGTIAVRVSSNDVVRQISTILSVPIVATSANMSGHGECYSIDAVRKQFEGQEDQPDFYLDAGLLEQKPPSTIIKEQDGEVVVVRQGSVRIMSS